MDTDATGEISIQNVVEILPVDALPAEVGPLTFVALVRNLPQGPAKGAFLIQDPSGEEASGRLPFETGIPAGAEARQIAIQVTVPQMPVKSAGWFHFGFEWEGELLGANRFAVGLRSGS